MQSWSFFILLGTVVVSVLQAEFIPDGLYNCMVNDDCKDEQHCCSYTAALGKKSTQEREVPPDWDGMVHYCLPWKNENATWCVLDMQFSKDTEFYRGLCPCGPGFLCTPTTELDEESYPRDQFGKCTPDE